MMNEVKKDDKSYFAWQIYEELKKAVRMQATLFLVIGRCLKLVRDESLYLHLGEGGFGSFGEFLSNPEIGIKPSTAYLYIRIYEYYIEKLAMKEEEVASVPINRLMRLLPILRVREEDEAKSVIKEISTLGNKDYEAYVAEKLVGYEVQKPLLYIDKETGLYVFEFDPASVLRIVNTRDNKVIFEGGNYDKQKDS